MSIQINTERLILREFIEDDAEDLNLICNQAHVLKWMPDWESTVEDTRRWINYIKEEYTRWTKDTARIMLAVVFKTSGRLIGMVGIGNKEEVDNEIEIAYFISQECCNKGYISEAAKAMVEWVFKSIEPEHLIAIVEPENFPSQKVVEKCGFKKLETRMVLNSGETNKKPFDYYRLHR